MSTQESDAAKIFLDAVENCEPDRRSEFVNDACGENPQLRARVFELLGALEESNSLLDGGAAIATLELAPLEKPGVQIGPYKLLEQIGEGGFGVVILAEQATPIRRRVALKIVKPGMDTRQVLARFGAERQVLALMDHPGIAKVFDAGVTEQGRPYFVMELVQGVPINQYCDECQLATRERLELFIAVCLAVQHAHQKGIIHRDLKPTNVLVALQDGRPVPKIIDFGVAKAIEQQLTEQTLTTGFAQMIGTPMYMSPEQAELSPLGVDTRTDIYALGVLLYELLTGTTPFDKDRLHSASYDELRRIIREEEPPRPSTRLTTLAAGEATTIAEHRRTDARRLGQQVRGELDWVVMKCLEKDRNRRYESAGSLASDVERYLGDMPVEARSASRTYRIKKFIRRNKVGVLAGSAVVAALTVGLAVATVGLIRARTEAARSEQVAQFLKDMLTAASPSVARGRDATLFREVLDKTAERIERDLPHQPEVQGDLWMTLGNTCTDLGDYARAVQMYQHAVDSFRQALGSESTKLAFALGRLGAMQSYSGNMADGKVNAALGLQLARECGDKKTVARCLECSAYSIGGFLCVTEVVPQYREAIALEKELGDDPVFLARLMLNLGGCLDEPGTFDEAESLMRQALALQREHRGVDHPSVSGSLYLLTQCLVKQRKLDEAEAFAREALAISRKVYAEDHPLLTLRVAMLVNVLTQRDKSQEVEAVLNEAVKSFPSNSGCWGLLGEFNAQRGNLEAAVEQFSRATQLTPSDNATSQNLANALLSSSQIERYRAYCHQILERSTNTREADVAESVAKTSLLLPVDGADFEHACQLADYAATANEPTWFVPWIQNTKALADYRRRRFDSAIDWAQRASSSADATAACKASAFCIQACCYAQMQRVDSSRDAIAQADRITLLGHDKTREEYYAIWRDWFVAESLHHEAAELIEEQAADKRQNPSNKPRPAHGDTPATVKNFTPPTITTTKD